MKRKISELNEPIKEKYTSNLNELNKHLSDYSSSFLTALT